MPDVLKNALRDELIARDLYDRACGDQREKEVFGGESDEETRNHFADRFKTSAARTAYVLLSPHGHFSGVSRDVFAAIFDGSVAILDIPCGSGGGLHGLLSSVYELRAQSRLPRTPITVKILGGDLSPLAMEIHASMLARVHADYSRLGVRLEWQHLRWDVTDPYSTTRLMDSWLSQSQECEEHLVFVSAFSGFAHSHLDKVSLAVRDIALRLGSKMLHIVWIEPGINESKKFLPRLLEKIMGFFGTNNGLEANLFEEQVEFFFLHPFTNAQITGRARVITFQRFSP